MASAEKSLAPAQPTSEDLRQLWNEGERGLAIRGALEGWERLIRQPDELHWLAKALSSSGLPAEAFVAQVEATRRHARVSAWEPLIASILRSRDPWWARDLLGKVGGDSRELQALGIEVELAVGDPAPSIAAWVRAHRDEAALEAAVRWWVRADRVEEAARLADETPGLTLWRARFALWRNRPDVARPLLATLAPDPEVRCLEAIAFILDGDLAQGEARLRELLDTEARAEAWTWLATVLRKQQRYDEAIQAADTAGGASLGFNLVARLERELATEYEWKRRQPIPQPTRIGWLERFTGSRKRIAAPQIKLRTIDELENARLLYPLGLKPHDSITAVEAILDRFAGNHTERLSTTDGTALTSHPLPEDPRQLGAAVQLVLWTRGAAATRALYDELAPRVNDHPLYRIYHGELELWMGAYERAERIFRRILDRDDRVRWAWIGLGASVMLQGDLQQAQKIWEQSLSPRHCESGPTMYVYRGECYRRQGKQDLARNDLETALRQKPQRLSARINLALLDRDPDALARAEADCVAFAPFLMAELHGSPADKLEQVLEAMRGNRSSSEWNMSYHLWGHVWRRGAR